MPWPSLSLPSNVQNRLLSYLLRRALGRFVSTGLDVDAVQAQLAQGAVDLRALELDPAGLNELLVGLPLKVTRGTVDHVNAKIAGWSLAVVVDRLELELDLGGDIDLAESFVAQEEIIEAFTDTLAQSLADLELHAPGAFPTDPRVEDTSMLAGLVEQLVARLTVHVNTVVIHISHQVEYELRVHKVVYDHGVRFNNLSLRITDLSSSAESGYADMLMSQAVGDLRQSSATVYASAFASAYTEDGPAVLSIDDVVVNDGQIDVSPVQCVVEPWHLEALLQAFNAIHSAQSISTKKPSEQAPKRTPHTISLQALDVSLAYQQNASLKLSAKHLAIEESLVVGSIAVDDVFNGTRSVLAFDATPAITIAESITVAPVQLNLPMSLADRLLPLRSIVDLIPRSSSPSSSKPKHVNCAAAKVSITPPRSTSVILDMTDLSFGDASLTMNNLDISCRTRFLSISDLSFDLITNTCLIPVVNSTLDRPTIESLQFVADDVAHWLGSTKKSEREQKTSEPIRLLVEKVDITLLVPTKSGQRSLIVYAAVTAELGPTIHVAINDLEVNQDTTILEGAIDLRFGSSAARETSIDLAFIGINLALTTDLSIIQDVAQFIKAPEGVFADVVPSEVTHVTVRVDDGSIVASLPNGSLKVVVHAASAKTDITAGDNVVNATVDLDILAAEADDFAPLVTADFDARLEKGTVTKLDVPSLRFRLAACADSLATTSTLVGDILNCFPKTAPPPPPPPAPPIDVFASIDDEAFRAAPHIGAGADMIDDDLPTHREYLDGSASADAVRVLYNAPFVLDDYWHRLEPVESTPRGQLQVRLACEGQILLHDGYDWASTRQAIEDETQAVRQRLDKIRQLLAAGQTPDPSMERASVLFNSVYIDPDDAWESLETPPQRVRSKRPLIEIAVKGGRVDFDAFDTGETLSRLHLALQAVDIFDHIKTSTWKTFLTEKRGGVRETGADMVRIELSKVRMSTEQEARLRMKILPLRLHVDQDALDFLKRFFGFRQAGESSPVFFQHVEIYPIELKLDYKPKRVDLAALRGGRTIELMNFFHFDGAEMTLRHVTLSGIHGSDLATTLNDLWTPDVKAHQLADVISGVSPIRSMVNVGSGVADLILLPLEQYRKDGRVTRGVQRGTTSFMRTTAMEGLKLGARLATGTQVVLEQAESVLGGRAVELDAEVISRYAHQPQDAREGIEAAYRSLATNVNSAAQTILAVPMEVYDENSSVRAVVRAVPIAVLKPMIGASEAVSKTLLGLRNGMSAEARLEQEEKYKR